ncbi:condensation domain-containing protein [Mucilaginibacter pedocola]|uniref:Phthiocerol/phthiodiolone dimycocerosyl transferase n=1 Tax=Mucilaginibacter pedocola TaxID=1792845 RepID=A0A1S9PBV3_9SPHI|nr:condensation domain-containing protein [Mucilaginibacter pedocola]OOQ58435.1 condensation protein [Mucilaginibacter pedocola]
MTNQQNRTLGAFEKTFWLLDQIDSKDFALAAEIEGRETVEAWQQALVKLQQRHPNLFAKVVLDQFSRPVLEHVNGITIPLRVLNVDDNYRWEEEAEKELATRFNTAEAPLLRAVLIQKPAITVLILASSHIVADGTSLTYLFRDLLNALAGKELQAMKPQLSNDESLGLPEDIIITDASHIASLANDFKAVTPKVSSIRVVPAITQRLIEKAREEGTTVHGAICAAVLTAVRTKRKEWSDKKIELISPICARGPLKLDDNYGLNITTHPVFFEGEQAYDFWEIARLAKAGLAGTDTEEHVKNYINFFRDLTFNSPDLQQMIDILKNAFNHEIMVTNLGKLKYGTDFGKLKLNAVYGPIVRSGKGMEQTVGALSSNGALCLTNTSDNPIEGLLEAIVETLAEACKADQYIAV